MLGDPEQDCVDIIIARKLLTGVAVSFRDSYCVLTNQSRVAVFSVLCSWKKVLGYWFSVSCPGQGGVDVLWERVVTIAWARGSKALSLASRRCACAKTYCGHTHPYLARWRLIFQAAQSSCKVVVVGVSLFDPAIMDNPYSRRRPTVQEFVYFFICAKAFCLLEWQLYCHRATPEMEKAGKPKLATLLFSIFCGHERPIVIVDARV